jgi:hypothetical protein
MTVHLDRAIRIGDTRLPAGDYEVQVDEPNGKVLLSRDAETFRLDASRRSSKMQVNRPSVQLRPVVAEPRWLLIVRTPPASEWVVNLESASDAT